MKTFQSIPRAFSDIKLLHTVFALPFAVLGAFLAAGASVHDGPLSDGVSSAPIDWRRFSGQLGLILLCMFFARTWAMLVNRIADRRFDAANPRTARRAVASGRLAVRDAVAVALAAAAGFVGACLGFWFFFDNLWPAALSLPTLTWIAFYSFTKRFTCLSHLFLGGALAASPLAAAIAIEPGTLGHTPSLWLMAGMVLVWVAGFDVLYALQDFEFDRGAGLHSVPARFGWRGALWISRTLHALALAALFAAVRVEPRFGLMFGAGVILTGALLCAEHIIVARRGLAGLPMAFFTVNGVVSCALGTLGSLDVVM